MTTAASYSIESVTLSSSRMVQDIVLQSVTDIEIYEHIDLPFLTGKIAFTDAYRTVDRMDFQGNEYCTIRINVDQSGDETIEKRFVVESLLTSAKVNQTTEVVQFSLYEDVLYHSQLLNVNRGYSGNPLDMLQSISTEYLNKKLDVIPDFVDVFQKSMKLVVPNMRPLDAMLWIKNRMTTSAGVPSYMFSSFALDRLFYTDLESVLNSDPINKNTPFFYGPSPDMVRDKTEKIQYLPIHSYTYDDTDKMYDIIGKGLVGAEYQYYDALSGRLHKRKFNYENETVQKLNTPRQLNNAYAPNIEMLDKTIQEHTSRRITQISGAGVYNLGATHIKSFAEEENAENNILKVNSRALKTHLMKAPMTIRVPGEGFLIPGEHRTIGNVLRVLFIANTSMSQTNMPVDVKKSGDYLMYATKHSFTQERYNIHVTLAKLANYKEDNIPV